MQVHHLTRSEPVLPREEETMESKPIGQRDAGRESTAPRRRLTVQEAAERLAVSQLTVYSWAAPRRISYHKIGRVLRFTEQDLDAIVERVEVDECLRWGR